MRVVVKRGRIIEMSNVVQKGQGWLLVFFVSLLKNNIEECDN